MGLLTAVVLLLMIACNLVMDLTWMFNFGKKVVGTENLLRRKTNHKMFLFSMGIWRTFITVSIVVFWSLPTMAVP